MSGVERSKRHKRSALEGGDEQTTLKREFQKFLVRRKAEGALLRFRKNWGGRIAGAGEPDFTGCARGLYWAVELKHPGMSDEMGSTPSPAQRVVIDDIVRAGGRALVTNKLDVACRFIEGML